LLNGFYLHYQPIFFLQDPKRLLGYEALLRHPSGLPPLELLGEVDRANLVAVWELRIFERAVEELLLQTPHMLFFNLTPSSFSDGNFLVRAERLLEKYGISSCRICVEVSEKTCSFESLGSAERWIEHGFFVALDDFGTGSSNFDAVLNFRFDYIKIDRLLVADVSKNKHKQDLLASLIGLFTKRSVYPILEGVEKEDDFLWLLDKKWDVGVQGFALAPPSDLEDVGES